MHYHPAMTRATLTTAAVVAAVLAVAAPAHAIDGHPDRPTRVTDYSITATGHCTDWAVNIAVAPGSDPVDVKIKIAGKPGQYHEILGAGAYRGFVGSFMGAPGPRVVRASVNGAPWKHVYC